VILALDISLEGEDERVYSDYAKGLKREFPGSAAVFYGMRSEEPGYRKRWGYSHKDTLSTY